MCHLWLCFILSSGYCLCPRSTIVTNFFWVFHNWFFFSQFLYLKIKIIDVTLWQESVAAAFPKQIEQIATVGEELRRHDVQYCRLHNYDLTFAFYSKFPSWGSVQARGPRLARTPRPLLATSHYYPAIPNPRLLFAWWQYKISWINFKAIDILRNGHFCWEHLWPLSFFNSSSFVILSLPMRVSMTVNLISLWW